MKKVLIVVFALMILMALVPMQTMAFDPAALEKLKTTNKCAGCQLDGANLMGVNLSNANLMGANLARAILIKTNLSKAFLSTADLTGAVLMDANLEEALMAGTNLTGAFLSGANLKGAKVNLIPTDANFIGATWTDGRKCGHGSIGACK